MNTSLNQLDLDEAKHDIRDLLKATAGYADEAVVAARKRLSSALDRAGSGADCAGRFVKGHACETALIALLAGIAAGYILSRTTD